jgi:hypothetical protein
MFLIGMFKFLSLLLGPTIWEAAGWFKGMLLLVGSFFKLRL